MLNLSLYKFVTNTYRMLCLLLTIALVSWCIHEYKLDRDITEILLRKYHHHEDDIHPSITVCYTNPYQDHKFTKYYKNYSSGSASTFSAAYQSLINGVAKAQLDKYRNNNIRRIMDLQKLRKCLNRLRNDLYVFKLSKKLQKES